MVTTEDSWAFVSTGAGFADIINFRSNLAVNAEPVRESTVVQAAGRTSPIALFGTGETLEISGSATIFPDFGSSPKEVEQFIRVAGIVCYRDATGRRMFGRFTGSVGTSSPLESDLDFTVLEAT